MSTGAVLQLSSIGLQDKFLTGNPQITHFKSVIKRHTNFSIETVENYYTGNLSSGNKIEFPLQRVGDLISNVYLKITLPALQTKIGGSDGKTFISWANAIGYMLLEFVDIKIGNKIIDRRYGQWMNIWSELSTNASKRDALNTMVGKHDVYTSATQTGSLNLTIPLQFWFCNNLGLSLPIVALQKQKVSIIVKFKSFDTLWTTNLSNREDAEAILNSEPNINNKVVTYDNASLLVDYIFLDCEERRFFAQNKHYYLLEQVQEVKQSINLVSSVNTIDIPFNHPVKELIWIIQTKEAVDNGQLTNYSYEKFTLSSNPSAPIENALIRFEGTERFETRNEDYFRITIPYAVHTRVPEKYIYVYSFSEFPEKLQPYGTANFSRIDTPTLHLKMKSGITTCEVTVYALSYNIYRIMGGISGILFAN